MTDAVKKKKSVKVPVRKILRYTLTPQLMPRIRSLFYTGFSSVAFFMAQTYRTVRLLPDGHPYLNPANAGRFGIRHVVAEAGNNLKMSRENIDQIVLYGLTLIGLVLLAAQFFMLIFAGFLATAHAAAPFYASSTPLDFFSYFSTPDATNDLAFVLLDRVFGIPGVAGPTNTSFFADAGGGYSCVVQGIVCFDLGQSTHTTALTADRTIYTNYERTAVYTMDFPWAYHEALRGMLQVYSVGLLVIGVFIFLYFMFAVAAETAQTGTAFGRRFNHIWAPIRMVIAMGLLVPITYGLNPAQWVLMFAARWGSSFATNGWVMYSTTMAGAGTLLGETETLVATPTAPPVNTLMEFGSILATCKIAYENMYAERTGVLAMDPVVIDAWLVNPLDVGLAPRTLVSASFDQALEYFNNGDIIVRFGELRDEEHQTWDGRVVPYCGEIKLQITKAEDATEPGAWAMQESYYTLITTMWDDATGAGTGISGLIPGALINFRDIGTAMAHRHISIFNDSDEPLPTAEELGSLRIAYRTYVEQEIQEAVTAQQGSPEWLEQLTELGWGGAAIWYNKIAQLNGGLVSAVYSMPTVKLYPWVMEKVRKARSSKDSTVSGETAHRVYTGEDDPMALDDDKEAQINKALYEAQGLWHDNYGDISRGGNIYVDTINAIFGTEGLFNITTNEAQAIHPLAQLAAIGRTIVDSAIRNLGYSAAAGLSGGIANMMQEHALGTLGGGASSFLAQIALIGLSVGFVLFYIIPILPFVYFFFAVGGWVKAIFEAMVGVPLWALAHIRIDGDGLPPDAAMGGYYLIFEIFLRPMLIIFGFIASITIFTAQVQILHEIWPLVVSNVAGYDVDAAGASGVGQTGSIEFLRRAVDRFFFTVMYAIMVYMMAMSSFKLVDLVPNNILRWMGSSVSNFGDQSGEVAEHLVRNSFIGTNMVGGRMSQVGGSAKGAVSEGGKAVEEISTRQGGA